MKGLIRPYKAKPPGSNNHTKASSKNHTKASSTNHTRAISPKMAPKSGPKSDQKVVQKMTPKMTNKCQIWNPFWDPWDPKVTKKIGPTETFLSTFSLILARCSQDGFKIVQDSPKTVPK